MMTHSVLRSLCFFLSFCFSASVFSGQIDNKNGYTYVIVHGSTSGGWHWKRVSNFLEADNHTVYRPTLTGLGERAHLASADISLTTHIDDIVNVILFEKLDNIVLVGHSYAGMVITGVMEKIPERIGHSIFLDAIVPDHGMSSIDARGMSVANIGGKIKDGLVYFPWINESQP